MRIYTSYIAKTKQVIEQGKIPISIVRLPQHWMTMQNMPELSPTKELLNGFKYGNISEEEFTTKFDNYLSNISPSNIIGQLEAISMLQGGKDIVLVCYEKTGDFCHRHIISDWLTTNTDYNIEELKHN